MAKIKVLGDIVQVIADIKGTDFQKLEKFNREALRILDKDNKPIFAISRGEAHISQYGITFCNVDYDGNLYMTTNNPCTDHSDKAKERAILKEEFAPILMQLQIVEDQVKEAMSGVQELYDAVDDSICFIG